MTNDAELAAAGERLTLFLARIERLDKTLSLNDLPQVFADMKLAMKSVVQQRDDARAELAGAKMALQLLGTTLRAPRGTDQ